jgi:fermentation-respiration switch protein FrsA (DUF1100 family)
VAALILMAPATAWFTPNDSLKNVALPIQLWAGERDPFTPLWQAQLILDLVPHRDRVAFRVVPNAGHFSFLSPFPPAMKLPGFLPAFDPAGFDREAFHAELNVEMRAFLQRAFRNS